MAAGGARRGGGSGGVVVVVADSIGSATDGDVLRRFAAEVSMADKMVVVYRVMIATG